MLFNYLKIAFRSLVKFKGYTLINLAGLAMGLTAGILTMVYVLDELSYDKFHTKADRIYRVETAFKKGNAAGLDDVWHTNAWPIGHVLKRDYPEVEAVLYTRGSRLTITHEGRKIHERIHYASPEFFQIFSFELRKGNPANALVDPYSIVITEDMEKKYFNGDGLDKTLLLEDTIAFTVTGVLANVPSNSHIQLDMLVSFSTYTTRDRYFSYDGGWGNINMRNYVLLHEGVDVNSFFEKAGKIYSIHAAQMLADWGVEASVVFMPLNKLYLTAKSGNGMGPLGSIDRVYLVSGISVFVIFLACINFINLTTARSMYRAKEVSLRKVVGSSRRSLISQFLGESFMLVILALFLALVLSGLVLPFFNQLLSRSYTLVSLLDSQVIAATILLVMLVTVLSGYYPAIVISSKRPAEVLKGKMQSGSSGVKLRRVLVVFQFAISVLFVMGTLIVIDQLNYMQRKDLGFAKDEIFVVDVSSTNINSSTPNAFKAFKEQIQSLAMVGEVAMANALPGRAGWQGQIAYPEGRAGADAVSVEYMAVDEDYVSTMGLQLIAGRGFSKDREAELKEGLILNETAVQAFGFLSPAEAIGKKIVSPSGNPAGEVIGVVKDYHQFGLQQEIGPITMDYAPGFAYLYAIRYKAADTQQLIASLKDLWQKNFPAHDFAYFFLDKDFERQYESEERLAKVFALFAAVTIGIGVIGLLGLVSFMVASRTKEIGVRKVLGADVIHITSLLSKEFLTLVLIANAIAFPLAWYFANEWLQGFASRTEVDPLIFILTLLIALGITLITISYQTIKAAMADPVESLRYE